MPLKIVIRMTITFFTTTATHLLLKVTLVYMFTTHKPWGKWGPSLPFRDWVITCMLFPRSIVSVQPCMILDEKAIISSFFVILTASFKSVRSTVWLAAASLWIESSAHWQANNWAILNPFMKVTSSLMSFFLIMLMLWLMVSVPRVTSTQDPRKVEVESGMMRATWSSL